MYEKDILMSLVSLMPSMLKFLSVFFFFFFYTGSLIKVCIDLHVQLRMKVHIQILNMSKQSETQDLLEKRYSAILY